MSGDFPFLRQAQMFRDASCPNCGKLLGKLRGETEIKCTRCKSIVHLTLQKIGERKSPSDAGAFILLCLIGI